MPWLAAALKACEHAVLPADGHRFDGVFGCIVVELQAAILKVGQRLWHPAKGMRMACASGDLPDILGSCAESVRSFVYD